MKRKKFLLLLFLLIPLVSADSIVIGGGGNTEVCIIQSPEINICFPSYVFPSGPGGGGRGIVPNITEFEPTLKCSLQSIQTLGICLTDTGNVIWRGYPNAGVLILVMAIYIILLLLAINGLLKETKKYFKILFYSLLVIVFLIIAVWALQDCQVEQLGDIGSCVSNFGENIWPGHNYAGILLLGILLLVIIILLVLGNQRKRRKDVKKQEAKV